MNLQSANIIPITEARKKLGSLAKRARREDYVILTKAGKAEAALVDVDYLARLQKVISKLYQKTFLDPQLLPFTREFSEKEIAEWEKEDRL